MDVKNNKLWFARYAASSCSWAKAVVMEKLARIEETEDEETHMWLARAQTRDLHKSSMSETQCAMGASTTLTSSRSIRLCRG